MRRFAIADADIRAVAHGDGIRCDVRISVLGIKRDVLHCWKFPKSTHLYHLVQECVQRGKNRIIWSIRRKTSTSEAKYLLSTDTTTTKSGVSKHGNCEAVWFWRVSEWAVPRGVAHFWNNKEKEKLSFSLKKENL